jgi:hypothetical protein
VYESRQSQPLEVVGSDQVVAHPAGAASGQGPIAVRRSEREGPESRVHGQLRQLEELLSDAERLLAYAASTGIEVGDDVRRSIISAAALPRHGWTDEDTSSFLRAMTALSARLKPVSAESLRKCDVNAEASRTLFRLRVAGICLGVLIVPFSVLAFIASATCDAIHKDIDANNALAVALVRESANGDPANPSTDPQRHSEEAYKRIQLFAQTTREIDRRALQLRRFSFIPLQDPFGENRSNKDDFRQMFQLPTSDFDFDNQVDSKVRLYQEVRTFAQSVQEMVQTSFGAVTICVLPVLYALLGACAFLIRSFEEQRKTRTFTSTGKLHARFLIAGIGGLVVGLFRNFSDVHDSGLSPLAIAFMVGYGVDVFFFFIDGLLETFARTRNARAEHASSGEGVATH